ncbi:transglutaminase-like cysteine peptidase [Thiomicrorhabdus sp.]|uniref:transglutaminase-like cysteine peptidase n=1 Tax=Thiomicrorhabdus sp. TaxID=2039724 RepID=UPI0029C98347|nr:transglutaminase-like cysteine peptidase [Thiomicrorhabdus sp.]
MPSPSRVFSLQLGLFALLLFFSFSQYHWLSAKEPPRVVSPQEIQKAKTQYNFLAGLRLQAWQDLVDESIDLPEKIQLQKVNNFFNEVRFVSDQKNWGKKDYWATPVELLSVDAGDCEDYSVAKYFTLKALGVPESKLYLTYVKAIRLNQAHMVLTYYQTPKAIPLVLDNLNRKILPATLRTDLLPVYSFNGEGLWKARQRGKGKEIAGGSRQLKAWDDLLKRLGQN